MVLWGRSAAILHTWCSSGNIFFFFSRCAPLALCYFGRSVRFLLSGPMSENFGLHFRSVGLCLSMGSTSAPIVGSWKDLLSAQYANTKPFSLSFVPEESPEVSFSQDDLAEEQNEWDLSLIGYVVGKHPFYGLLLAAIKRKWTFKGSLELLTLDGDFFLLKFSCKEDYDCVWDNGPCFLNEKPIFFQKWKWDFRPTKANFIEIPLWIKLSNFPLYC